MRPRVYFRAMYPPNYPGGPPAGYPGQPPAEVPKAPKVLGILSIVFGGIVALFTLFNVVGGASPDLGSMGDMGGFDSTVIVEAEQQFVEDTRMTSLVSGLLNLVMATSLIFIGIGQFKYKKWAAPASVKWGIVALLVLAVDAVIQFTVTLPAMEDLFARLMAAEPDLPDLRGILKAASVVPLLLNLPYPIILIAIFRKPRVVAAMTN
ncbi:MAG: hypothetical protein ACRDKW_02285 [Actinomycetota bacterium]